MMFARITCKHTAKYWVNFNFLSRAKKEFKSIASELKLHRMVCVINCMINGL